MATSLLQIRVDSELKEAADALFKDLGLDTSTAVRMFLKQALKKSAIPFRLKSEPKDDFYNEENVRILKERYEALKAGGGVKRELINE